MPSCVMLRSPNGNYVVTTGYGGGVRVWREEWECVGETSAPMASQNHVSIHVLNIVIMG